MSNPLLISTYFWVSITGMFTDALPYVVGINIIVFFLVGSVLFVSSDY